MKERDWAIPTGRGGCGMRRESTRRNVRMQGQYGGGTGDGRCGGGGGCPAGFRVKRVIRWAGGGTG